MYLLLPVNHLKCQRCYIALVSIGDHYVVIVVQQLNITIGKIEWIQKRTKI